MTLFFVLLRRLASDFAERKVLACAGGEAVSLEELAARCGMQAAALAPVLMRLELSGRVKMLPGQRYIFL